MLNRLLGLAKPMPALWYKASSMMEGHMKRGLLTLLLGICGPVTMAQGLAPAWGELSLESLLPTREDRQIETHNLHLLFGKAENRDSRMQYALGLTLTQAEGSIRLDENGSTVTHDANASGAGPAMRVRFAAWRNDWLAFWLQAQGAVLLYDREFPYGGDRYNFMWRVGPALEFRLGERLALNLQYHWAHVSNGQGTGDHNPAYGARGASLGLRVSF